MLKRLLITFTILFTMTFITGQVYAMDKDNTLIMETSKGRVTIELKPEIAPNHVERIKKLVSEKFYDGIIFHRVIPDFMAQTGDPTGTGMGGSDYDDLDAEFSDVPFLRGTLGMARSSSPNSANSQFFITFGPTSFLNGQYTVFGQVTDGMDVIDAINAGEPPADPDKIITMRMAQDVVSNTDSAEDNNNKAEAVNE